MLKIDENGLVRHYGYQRYLLLDDIIQELPNFVNDNTNGSLLLM